MDTSPRSTVFLRPTTGPRADRRLIATGGALLVAVWVALFYASWHQYETARRHGAVAASVLARQVEDWTHAVLWRIGDLMVTAEARLQAAAVPGDLITIFERYRAADPRLFRRIELRTPDGRLVVAVPSPRAAEWAPPLVEAAGGLAIGLPVQIDGEPTVAVARPLVNGDGQQTAVLRVEIAPAQLAGLAGDLDLPADTAVALMRGDGEPIAASPEFGGRAFGAALLQRLRQEAAAGAAAMTRTLDDTMRLIALRDAAARPSGPRPAADPGLVVLVGLSEQAVFGEADRRTLFFVLVAAMVSLLALAVGKRLLVDQCQRARIDRELSIAAEALGNLDAAIAVIDADGAGHRVIAANAGLMTLLDRPADAILGQPWADIVGANGGAWLDQKDARPIEARFARRDGETSWIEIRVARIAASADRGALALVALRDITQRKQTEAAMLRAKNQAEIANRAKSDFLANMSHELRTPLNAILGFSEIISKQLLGPVGTVAYREYANDIWVSGTHLLSIISDILDFAKIEATTLKLEESELDLGRLVGTCVRFMAARSTQAEVEVVVDIPADFPHVVADDLRLKQILLNLLSNAIKFSPAGSTVTVRASQTPDGAVDIAVVDKGCGMSAGEVEVAMQPFRQVESTMVKRAEGTGLGLPLAKRLVELHGGALLIDTEPQRGTTVVVRLPSARRRSTQVAA